MVRTTPKPTISTTSSLTNDIGATIADYVRADALSELIAVVNALVERGYRDIALALFGGQTICMQGNHTKSYERGVIKVAGVTAQRPHPGTYESHLVCIAVSWWVASNLVAADWEVLEGK